MTYRVKYHRGETIVGEVEEVATIEEARTLIDAKSAVMDFPSELAVIFRISTLGVEDLEESRRLRPIQS